MWVCLSEDLLKVDGMDMKLTEPITAAHLINAARLGNSKADAVLNKGESTKQKCIQNKITAKKPPVIVIFLPPLAVLQRSYITPPKIFY